MEFALKEAIEFWEQLSPERQAEFRESKKVQAAWAKMSPKKQTDFLKSLVIMDRLSKEPRYLLEEPGGTTMGFPESIALEMLKEDSRLKVVAISKY